MSCDSSGYITHILIVCLNANIRDVVQLAFRQQSRDVIKLRSSLCLKTELLLNWISEDKWLWKVIRSSLANLGGTWIILQSEQVENGLWISMSAAPSKRISLCLRLSLARAARGRRSLVSITTGGGNTVAEMEFTVGKRFCEVWIKKKQGAL